MIMPVGRTAGVMKQGQRQRTVPGVIPAPIRGINVATSFAEMQPDECIYTYNLIAKDYGAEVRLGYEEWANGWTGNAKTVIPFQGKDSTEHKLWVATPQGIYDCTTEDTTSPTQKIAFASTAGNAGICHFVTMTTDGANKFVLLVDEENGYYVWTQSTDTWAKITMGGGATQVAGVDPADFDFIAVWKNQVWFVEKETGNAWYLSTLSIYGTATKFTFSSQFVKGGILNTLHNWTLDGGVGVDDYLVGVSTSGDVIIYKGTDPSSDIELVGKWSIGVLPDGKRNWSEFGGELYLLSSYGMVGLSNLLNGANPNDLDTYISRNVAPYLRAVLDDQLTTFGWQVVVHPKENLIYINAPARTGEDVVAFCMYFGNAAWSMVRGITKNHTAEWLGDVYWCDNDKLWIERGNVDKVHIDAVTDGDAQLITWDMLTAFSKLGEPGRMKRVHIVRPNFLSQAAPAFDAQIRYDYAVDESDLNPVANLGSGGIWGTGLWGVAQWVGGLTSSFQPRGATGIGRTGAVVLRGTSSVRTNLVEFDIAADFGGIL